MTTHAPSRETAASCGVVPVGSVAITAPLFASISVAVLASMLDVTMTCAESGATQHATRADNNRMDGSGKRTRPPTQANRRGIRRRGGAVVSRGQPVTD